jgi:hypothetical protein
MTPADPGPSFSPPPTGEELRAELVRFARRLLELEEAGRLLDSPADLQTVLGELRRRLFAWEVRKSAELGSGPREPGTVDSDEVVREAREAEDALRRELDAEAGGEDPETGS